MSEPTPAKCHCGSSSWARDLDDNRYMCMSCYRPLWTPMETAPKDGTTILVYGSWMIDGSVHDVAFAYWDTDDMAWQFEGEEMLEVFYWMHLPEPPKLG